MCFELSCEIERGTELEIPPKFQTLNRVFTRMSKILKEKKTRDKPGKVNLVIYTSISSVSMSNENTFTESQSFASLSS